MTSHKIQIVLCSWLLLVLAGCPKDDDTPECTQDQHCPAGQTCLGGFCRESSSAEDSGLRRDMPSGSEDDAQPDDSPDLPIHAEDLTDEQEGEPDIPAELSEEPDTPDDDPLSALNTQCAGFCRALCTFLEDCGKDDPDCLVRCGSSHRYQQLSPAACAEGTAVIGLEDCRLWLDCGGRSCAIDEMCLEVFPGVSYQCAPLCDHTQSQPACSSGVSCSTVMDAQRNVMTALGMCWSLF